MDPAFTWILHHESPFDPNMAGFHRLCRELEAGAQEAAHEAALDYGRIFTKAAID